MPIKRSFPRFSLKASFVLVVIVALLIAWAKERHRLQRTRELATVTVEVYTDRAAFERRLNGLVRRVDFDDIDTSKSDCVSFQASRYASRGVHIQAVGGQFAARTFGFPKEYPAASPPNSYAPGPKGKNPGGNKTDVSFTVGSHKAVVAGFGVTFIDADYPNLGASSLTVYGWADRQIGTTTRFRSPSGGQMFRGIIAVDSQGNPIPAISRVQLINGTGWPGVDAGDGVTLDDMVFAVPQRDEL